MEAPNPTPWVQIVELRSLVNHFKVLSKGQRENEEEGILQVGEEENVLDVREIKKESGKGEYAEKLIDNVEPTSENAPSIQDATNRQIYIFHQVF